MRFASPILTTLLLVASPLAIAQTDPSTATFQLPQPPAELIDTEGEDVVAVEAETQSAAESAPEQNIEPEPHVSPPEVASRPIDRAVLMQLEPPKVPGFNPALPDGGVSVGGGSNACPKVPQTMFVKGQMRVQPGHSYMLAVSRKHLTRLLTPFAQPDAISNSQHHEVLTEGRSLLLSLPPTSCEPIGLFIFDKAGDPELAINLTLWPQDIPQVDVSLVLPDALVAQLKDAEPVTNQAPAWDYRTPHVDALTTIMKPLALGQVPPGFSLKAIRGRMDNAPICTFPGTSVVFRQFMDSGRIKIFVASVRNTSRVPIEIRESDCAAPGVQAIAAWPSPLIDAAGSAELFVIVDEPATQSARTRPSVLE